MDHQLRFDDQYWSFATRNDISNIYVLINEFLNELKTAGILNYQAAPK